MPRGGVDVEPIDSRKIIDFESARRAFESDHSLPTKERRNEALVFGQSSGGQVSRSRRIAGHHRSGSGHRTLAVARDDLGILRRRATSKINVARPACREIRASSARAGVVVLVLDL